MQNAPSYCRMPHSSAGDGAQAARLAEARQTLRRPSIVPSPAASDDSPQAHASSNILPPRTVRLRRPLACDIYTRHPASGGGGGEVRRRLRPAFKLA